MVGRVHHLLTSSNKPLQQTKPRSILSAFKYRVRGFAAERQVVSRIQNL
jgi:hypothetical protein